MQEKNKTRTSPVNPSSSTLHTRCFRHPRVDQIERELKYLIYPGSQTSVPMICGPTGTGKSTLARRIVETENEQAADQMEANPGLLPAVYVEAPNSGENEFSWRLLYERILDALGDHLDTPRSVYGIDPESSRMVRPYGAGRNNLASLRTAVERGLRARWVRFLVIDEAAQIIRHAHSRGRLQAQLDTLKSLANECGTQIVLVGAYDLYPLVSLSGQLARRIHVLHFERYRVDVPEDLEAFATCVRAFERALPELWDGKLMRHTDALHHNTLGCIGTLSGVLTRAAHYAETTGKWDDSALKRALLSEAQRLPILSEINDGEAAIGPSQTRVWEPRRRTESTRPRSAA
ncbi:ATP-binding protein [Paraburkholderia sp.]|uniref:ATP-binding protein n=1 Tax=Paraburkholderia sp. TaxID=1926495 RepID=UPI0025D620E8|nr:ATP-binding protein [Paraburkholderia sp.]